MNAYLRRLINHFVSEVWGPAYLALKSVKGSRSAMALRILLFHNVPEGQMESFKRLLYYILENHTVVTPEEAEALLLGQTRGLTDNRVMYLLTFDDGFNSNLYVAEPILCRYGVKAIFFVCPGLMDLPQEEQTRAIATNILNVCAPSFSVMRGLSLMSWSDLDQLVSMGHTIGAHGMYHRRLSTLNEAALRPEIMGAAERLEERLRMPIRWFAYPFGNIGSIDRRSLRVIGAHYHFCRSGVRGVNLTENHRLGLLAESVDLKASFEYQRIVVEGGLDFFYYNARQQLRAIVESM